MDEGKKLKRGLSDISALFSSRPHSSSIPPSAAEVRDEGFHALGIYHASEPSFDYAQIFCQTLAQVGRGTSILLLSADSPLTQAERSRLPSNTLQISFGELEEENSAACEEQNLSMTVFFSLGNESWESRRKIIAYLDRMILVMNSSLDSMIESYRLIKFCSSVQPKLNYWILMNDPGQDLKGKKLYELFSRYLSEKSGILLGNLGDVKDLRRGRIPAVMQAIYSEKVDRRLLLPARSEKKKLRALMHQRRSFT